MEGDYQKRPYSKLKLAVCCYAKGVPVFSSAVLRLPLQAR